jgi:hypothetical protein
VIAHPVMENPSRDILIVFGSTIIIQLQFNHSRIPTEFIYIYTSRYDMSFQLQSDGGSSLSSPSHE